MKTSDIEKQRKPQVSLALNPTDKAFIEKVAKKRSLSVTALLRMLAFDEGRRLGLEVPDDSE